MRCSVFIATSLDGFIARTDGGIDWLATVGRPDEDYGYQKFRDSIDVLVIGRKTYETALGFDEWPYAGKRCIVLTHRSPAPKYAEEFFDGPPAALVARLAAQNARRVYVDGGSVIRQFLAAGLIDDLTVSIIPILLGDGIRLFGDTSRDVPLTLLVSQAFPSGLVQVSYRARPPGREPDRVDRLLV
jgi:dihydrofolate reductase